MGVGELMTFKTGKGKRMKREMEVYERNIGVGEEKNVGIFIENIQKEEKCEEKIENLKEKHEKELKLLGEERRYYRRELNKKEKELKACSGKCDEKIKEIKIKAKAYVEKTKK